ncbi:MAG TPA: hypothetical protein VJ840_18660 [Gemmatimonadaceae bacterium]|nr:hypothetical protein [Gemmatimonadaceae bacterium]
MKTITTFEFDAARRAYTHFAIAQAARLARDVGFSYEPSDVAPSTHEEVCAEYRACRTTHRGFRVWNGASDRTVFTIPEGNYAFRFVHDVTSHAIKGRTFSLDDELTSGNDWVRRVAAAFGADSVEAMIAYADTCGQSLYVDQHNGAFPEDQLAFVMESLCVGCGPCDRAQAGTNSALGMAGHDVY